MSQITENTIVVKTIDVEKFHKAVEYHQDNYSWITNVIDVYSNNDVAIFTFDCNGEPLGVEEEIKFLILETNYLDGEPFRTQIYDVKKKHRKDARYRAKYWIEKLIGKDDLNSIMNSLKYTDGRI